MTPLWLLFLQLVYAVLISGGQVSLGSACLSILGGGRQLSQISAPYFFLFGLFIHLQLVLLGGVIITWSAGPSPAAVHYLILALNTLLILFPLIKPRSTARLLAAMLPGISLQSALFLVVILLLGATIFQVDASISTYWINNYGDLAFHLGVISSFSLGANFPPQYPVFAGEILSYPFFIDLWSAVLWQPFRRYETLPLVFLGQWTLLWLLIYKVLNRPKLILLPWALLFGGGSFPYIIRTAAAVAAGRAAPPAHEFIGLGYPWTPFISTIWVTQRPILLGIAALLVAMELQARLMEVSANSEAGNPRLLKAAPAAILSLGLLAHVHTAAAGLAVLIAVQAVSPPPATAAEIWSRIRLAAAGLLPGCLALPILWRKHSIASLVGGWEKWDLGFAGIPGIAAGSAAMWAANALPAFLLFAWLIKFGKKTGPSRWVYPGLIAAALVFILANFVQLAVWDWDQIKLFVALYAILLFLCAEAAADPHWISRILLVLLIVPGAFESIRTLYQARKLAVYSAADRAAASEILENTPANAIISAKPLHNSPVTLSGRRMFLGYDGTLYSHGIEYAAREQASRTPDALVAALVQSGRQNRCPAYLFAEEPAAWIELYRLGRGTEQISPHLFRVITDPPGSGGK